MKESPELRREAWIGDSVLGLYAREWILENTGKIDAALYEAFSSNQFLSGLGNPTGMEANIGRIYSKEGLKAAFLYIEKEIQPLFLKQKQKRELASKGHKK